MNCEHFLFNSKAKYDALALAPVLALTLDQSARNIQSVLGSYRILITRYNVLFRCKCRATSAYNQTNTSDVAPGTYVVRFAVPAFYRSL